MLVLTFRRAAHSLRSERVSRTVSKLPPAGFIAPFLLDEGAFFASFACCSSLNVFAFFWTCGPQV